MKKKKILAVSGSTKKKSSNLAVLEFVGEIPGEAYDFQIYEGIEKLPHFVPGIADEDLPEEVQNFLALIANSDAVIFCSPEYVFSLPGSLKNALEWTVSTTVFSGKPVAAIVAAASGEKAFESLVLILRTIETVLPEKSTLLIKGIKGKTDVRGKISDKNCREQIREVVHSLIACINEQNPVPSKFLQ